MTDAYHTALPGGVETDAPPREWWAWRGNHAFVHDVAFGLPPEMIDASVLYAELPWADGFDEFARRAGDKVPLRYEQWLYALNRTLATCGKPWVIVGGYGAARHLGCEWFQRIDLNGSVAWAMGAGAPPPGPDVREAQALIRQLLSYPECAVIGDFCAGYGRTARLALEAGKQFIVTDVNPACIGHIAREAPKWPSNTI